MTMRLTNTLPDFFAGAEQSRDQAVEASKEPDEVVKRLKGQQLRVYADELRQEMEPLQDAVQASEKLGDIRGEISGGLTKLKGVLKALGETTEAAKVPDAILGEMYLILPTTTLRKAEKAASAVLRAQLTAYLSAEDQPKESETRDAINAFVADIRRLLGKEKLIPQILGTSLEPDSIVKRILDTGKLGSELERLIPELEKLKPQFEKLRATEDSDPEVDA